MTSCVVCGYDGDFIYMTDSIRRVKANAVYRCNNRSCYVDTFDGVSVRMLKP